MKRIRRCTGYTLVETLTTIAILLGLQALAWPSMADFLVSMRLRSGADALLSSLNRSRAEAVQRNARVVLCKSPSGTVCVDGAQWQEGWVVFQDFNNNGIWDAAEPLIYRQEPLQSGVKINGNGPVESYVSYTTFGQAQMLNGAFQSGTFAVCSTAAGRTDGFVVVIAPSGRPRMAKAVDQQCG